MKRTQRWITALSIALLAGGCGGTRSAPVPLHFERLELEVAVDPAEPRFGENALWLALRTRDGQPLDDAHVEARVLMHAMGAMPAMGGPAAVTPLGRGRYRADFELAMGGTWQVELVVRIDDESPARAEGTLTVGAPGLRLAAIDSRDATAEPDGARDASAGAPPDGSRAAPHPAEFVVSPERLQRVGVETMVVGEKALPSTLRAVGRVVAPESELVDVSLKVRGWATKVAADALGARVERGAVLFEVYSPELLTAQQEYVESIRSQTRAHGTSAPDRADALVRASRNRLRLWDVGEREIARLAETLEVREHIPIRAPIAGYVVEKSLVQGSAFEPGQRLYRLAPLSKVWIEAEVYEADLGRVRVGERARVALAYLPGQSFEARVAFLQPTLDPATRTARVRLEVDNRDLVLRPNMYANVELESPDAERAARVVVPQSAVLEAGRQSFVFRALGGGRFRPQAVTVGRRTGEEVEILSGLAAGDEIVRSGTFLVAAESRLRAALEQW